MKGNSYSNEIYISPDGVSFTLVNVRNVYSAVVSKSQLVYYAREIKPITYFLYSNTPFVLKCINCSLQTTHDYMGIRKK
jgi:hypothetical protein